MWLRWGILCGYKQPTFGAFLVFCIALAFGFRIHGVAYEGRGHKSG